MQSTRKLRFPYFIKSKSPYDNPSHGTCLRFLYDFFAGGQCSRTQLRALATLTSFALGQHVGSNPAGLELNGSSFPGEGQAGKCGRTKEKGDSQRSQHMLLFLRRAQRLHYPTETMLWLNLPPTLPWLRPMPELWLCCCAPKISTGPGFYPRDIHSSFVETFVSEDGKMAQVSASRVCVWAGAVRTPTWMVHITLMEWVDYNWRGVQCEEGFLLYIVTP